ncbi:MAG: membrane dipeptidase [Bacteroidota bacterium]
MLIFDGHLDLSMNAMEWNRDLRKSLQEINRLEEGLADKPDRGKATISFQEMRSGKVGLCMATQIARYVTPENPLPGWNSPEQAWAHTQAQLAWYHSMVEVGELRQIKEATELHQHVSDWEEDDKNTPIGFILSLEGADSILSMEHLERAWEYGLRAVGPAHYGPGVYAMGTDAEGGITERGKDLLQKMESLGMILDATHLCDDSFWDAMDIFHGAVWASHSNSRTLVPNHRQFSDEQYRELLKRGAVIGIAFDAWMLIPGWIRGKSTPEETGVALSHVVDHIMYVCELAGNTTQVALGTDLDGGFGKEQCPYDLESIARLPKVGDLLLERGLSQEDVYNIFSRNWLRFLTHAWT